MTASADVALQTLNASAAFFGDRHSRPFTRVAFGDSRVAVYGCAVADLDGDRNLDIAVARSDAPNMLYFGDGRKPGAR